jgi:hypothetical protein
MWQKSRQTTSAQEEERREKFNGEGDIVSIRKNPSIIFQMGARAVQPNPDRALERPSTPVENRNAHTEALLPTT